MQTGSFNFLQGNPWFSVQNNTEFFSYREMDQVVKSAMRAIHFAVVTILLCCQCTWIHDRAVRSRDLTGPSLPDIVDADPRAMYHPGRIRPTAVQNVQQTKTGQLVARNEFVVRLNPAQSPARFLKDLERAKIQANIIGGVPTFHLVQIEIQGDVNQETTEAKLRTLPLVEDVFLHFIRTAQASPQDWHIRNYGLDSVWKEFSGAGVRIAVLDTGIDDSLSSFKGRIVEPYSVLTTSARFEDGQIKKKGDVLRVVDHGTRVASVAAGSGDEKGILPGVAPRAEIMPIQVMGFHVIDESIYTNDLTILEGLARAMALRSHIINLSVGTDYAQILRDVHDPAARETILTAIKKESRSTQSLYNQAFARAREMNIWIVAAAGNAGDSAELEPIASHPLVISVGALDSDDRRASFSNYGTAVTTYAPGVGVPTYIPGGMLSASSGTSFSAPYVAGVLALLRSSSPNLTFDQARASVVRSNIIARTTILPEDNSTPVFDPVGLLSHGARTDQRGRFRTFATRFGDLFIATNDAPGVKLGKILDYYNRIEVHSELDPESRAAGPLVATNFGVIRERVRRGAKYGEMSVVAEAPLLEDQLTFLRENISTSDFIAIVCSRKMDRKCIPYLLQRLDRKQWNANTLVALWTFKEPGTHEKIEAYLTLIQSNQEWVDDECFAIRGLVETTSEPDAKDQKLIDQSILRYRAFEGKFGESGLVDYRADDLAFALIKAGRSEGLFLCIDTIEKIENRLETLANWGVAVSSTIPAGFGNTPEELGYRLRSLQNMLNESTTFPEKYNHQRPVEERMKVRDKFRDYAKKAEFSRARFRLAQ